MYPNQVFGFAAAPGVPSDGGQSDPWGVYDTPFVDEFSDADYELAYGSEPASYTETGGSDGRGTGINWGSVFLPIVKAGTEVAVALAKQELLQNTTYLKDSQGRFILNAAGQPVLANSAEGVKVASAAKKAGVLGAPWVMYAAIGVGVLAVLLLVMKRGRR